MAARDLTTTAVPSSHHAAECRAVVQVYATASGSVHALKGLTLDIPRGAVTAIVGRSGAGKSTLLRLLAGLERPTVGEVVIGGQPTSGLSGRALRRLAARQVGYVFQVPGANLMEDLDVTEHVRTAARMRSPREPGAVAPVLAALDLEGVARSKPVDLSAGEQQRLAFASAAVGGPSLIVADEPTASLDPDSADQLVALLARLAAQGQSMVISTHDRRVVRAADRVLTIRQGTLAVEQHRGGPELAVIDEVGRLALPPSSAARLSSRRARVTEAGDHIRIEPS